MPSSKAASLRRFARLAACAAALCVAAIAALWLWRTSVEVSPDEQISFDGQVRGYRLVIPRALSKPAPIVFAFHGIGDSPEGMAGYSKLDRLAGRQGFVLVYPKASKGMWATMESDERSFDDNPDVQFFDRLLERLSRRFNIDPKRVYVVGMSNGASFVQLLARARSNLIAAAAAHSGPSPRDFSAVGDLPPLLLLVGEEDFALSAMRSDAARESAAGRDVEFISIPGLGHEWSPRHNGKIWRFLSQHRMPR